MATISTHFHIKFYTVSTFTSLIFSFAILQIMWAAMRVETNMSLPVPTSGKDGEQSIVGKSHAEDGNLV